MASGLFFDPIAALRAAPLVSSTCTLLFAWDQHFFLSIFNKPDIRSKSNELLPSYFETFFYRGVIRVMAFLSLTVSSTILNHYINHDSLVKSQSLRWYTAGAAFAAGHLLFVPPIAPKVQAVIEDRSKGQSTKDLESWLNLNFIRACTVDLAAWVCFVIGVTRNVTA